MKIVANKKTTNTMPKNTAIMPYIWKRRSAQYRRRKLFATRSWVSCGERVADVARSTMPAGAFGKSLVRSLILFPILLHDVEGQHVERERHEEQHQAERECRERLRAV